MQFYKISAKRTLDHLKTSENGLSNQEVSKRKKQYGPNSIKTGGLPWWRKLIEPFLDVFTLVLASAAVISFLQGERLDGIIILVIIGISAAIFYIQRFSTERVLRSLNKSKIDSVNVLRNRRTISIPSTELVPGDIIMLAEGEKVPADIRILTDSALRADESVLTGESLPASKDSNIIKGDKPIYEQSNILFSGSFIVGGTAKGVVVATGNKTEFGTIATLAQRTEAKSPVQKKIDQLITRIVMIVVALAVVTFGLALARGLEVSESLRFVIALSVSAIPEGLPIAISVILVLGMRRMASKKVLVQQMRAIETLGVVTTIATDKTGTLTENKLTIHETWSLDKSANLDEAIARSINHSGNLTDPLDLALVDYSRKQGTYSEHRRPAKEMPFDQLLAMSASTWHVGSKLQSYIKGSPEAVMSHSKLSTDEKKQAIKALEKMTAKGYRVIALASIAKSADDLDQLVKNQLTFEGFIGIADVLRPEAAEAIKTALQAGVSVRMITGDHAETAYQIGKTLGMVTDRDQVLDCRTIDQLTDTELAPLVNKTKVFARVIPEQKYRLLTILKKNNITAMTGDGVNDVPALTNAHVGIAMGSGSSIAKDAGDVILLDNNFKTIIDAIREGRVIISNIRRMLIYLLATNAGEVLSMLGALAIGTRLPLEPVQILWVNLVTDTSMVIPLGLEPAEDDVMKKKPKSAKAPILSKASIAQVISAAIVIAGLTLVTYVIFEKSNGHAYAQTMAFAALVVSQWGNAFAVRSHTKSAWSRLRVVNRSFYVGLAISAGLQALVFFGPLGELLHITKVDSLQLLIVSIISLLTPIIVSDIQKLIIRRKS